jgi:DNA replication initiation complex subunit (GINS family)
VLIKGPDTFSSPFLLPEFDPNLTQAENDANLSLWYLRFYRNQYNIIKSLLEQARNANDAANIARYEKMIQEAEKAFKLHEELFHLMCGDL